MGKFIGPQRVEQRQIIEPCPRVKRPHARSDRIRFQRPLSRRRHEVICCRDAKSISCGPINVSTVASGSHQPHARGVQVVLASSIRFFR